MSSTTKVTYTGDPKLPTREIPVPVTADNLFGFNNNTEKTPASAPWLNGGGGLVTVPAEGFHFSGSTPKKVGIVHQTYNSDPKRPLVADVTDSSGHRVIKLGGGDTVNIMPGSFTLSFKFEDGKAGEAALAASH
jgi:hypothetical protein